MKRALGGGRLARRMSVLACAVAITISGCSSSARPRASAVAAHGTSTTGTPTPTPSTAFVKTSGLPNGVLAAFYVFGQPSSAIAAYGSLWVTTNGSTYLYRIDPATNRIIAKIDVGVQSCVVPSAFDGKVFVPTCPGWPGTPAVDPATDRVIGRIDGEEPHVVDGVAWSLDDALDGLNHVDMRTYKTIGNVHQVPVLDFVTGDGHVWVAEGDNRNGAYRDRIAELDAHTGATIRTIATPQPGVNPTMLFAFGRIWLLGGNTGVLLRIDPTSGASTTFHIPYSTISDSFNADLFQGSGSLWMRTADDTVSRVDPTTGRVVGRYPGDPHGNGGDTVPAFGSLWVVNFDTGSVWRDRI